MTAPSPPYYWIDRGKPLSRIPANIFQNDLDLPFRHFSLISVRSDGNLTSVRWDPRYPDSASINTAIEKIYEANSATRLIFYKDGWFREASPNRTRRSTGFMPYKPSRTCHIETRASSNRQPLRSRNRLPPLIKLMMRYPRCSGTMRLKHCSMRTRRISHHLCRTKCATAQFSGR